MCRFKSINNGQGAGRKSTIYGENLSCRICKVGEKTRVKSTIDSENPCSIGCRGFVVFIVI